MKHNVMLTIASLLSLLLLTFHLAGDIVYGWEPGGLANLLMMVPISVIWLYGALLLSGRRSGHIIMLLGGIIAMGVPYIHMKGKGVGLASRLAGTNGHLFFVWTLLAIGALGLFSVILAARALWNPQWGESK